MGDDLLLDPAIRIWVIVPIVLITFLVGVIRHHVSILLTSSKKVDVEKVRQSHVHYWSMWLCEFGMKIRCVDCQVMFSRLIWHRWIHLCTLEEPIVCSFWDTRFIDRSFNRWRRVVNDPRLALSINVVMWVWHENTMCGLSSDVF